MSRRVTGGDLFYRCGWGGAIGEGCAQLGQEIVKRQVVDLGCGGQGFKGRHTAANTGHVMADEYRNKHWPALESDAHLSVGLEEFKVFGVG